MTRVSIYNGKLLIGKLEFVLYTPDGQECAITYRGEAGIERNRLRIVRGCSVYDYRIADHPTQESVEFEKGFETASTQKRRRLPKNYSSPYFYGWQAGWKDKEKK